MRSKPTAVSAFVTAVLLVIAGLPTASAQSLLELEAVLPKMLTLSVRVVDSERQPVAGAVLTPWALRSSQGHGTWAEKDKAAGVGPKPVTTDEDGVAEVLYPLYRDLLEQVRTLSVSLQVDKVGFAYVSDQHIDVPLLSESRHEIQLRRGVSVDVQPLINDSPAELEGLFAFWSDGRSWQAGHAPEKLASGALRIPAMPPGAASVLLAKMQDDQVTHLSKITDFQLHSGNEKSLEVSLQPALRVEGRLSANTPRPVRHGRVKVSTLTSDPSHYSRASWFTWAPIQSDGTFVIESWPEGEAMQLIGICEGWIAESGVAPAVVENPRDRATDPFQRPQVFQPRQGETIEVVMTALAECRVSVVDESDRPVSGVRVASWPNVGWWNGGSQIYCDPLVRCEVLLRQRDYSQAVDKDFGSAFEGATDADGKVTLMLPEGKERLALRSEDYALPAFLGSRDVRIETSVARPTDVELRVQPVGADKLGEWDKLAGVVFGCSTREGRRICALPGVRKKMDEFAKRFREAKGQQDPALLAEAYATVAEAFKDAGDPEEASKWRRKAEQQAELVSSTNSE